MPPRTVDNLGVETSNRWAKDQALLDASIIKGSPAIPGMTQVDVTIPAYPSEVEILFGATDRYVPWALFLAPEKYAEQKKRLFTFQLIPLLGSDERQEAQRERIAAFGKRDRSQDQKQEQGEGEEAPSEWEEKIELDAEEKEKVILLTLLDTLHMLNRFLIDINSRRNQYQKG